MQDLVDRSRDKKERRATNKLLKDAGASGRGTPISDTDSRGRKGKKGKSKMNDYEPAPVGGKRKRGMKSMSVTPSINGDDDDDRDSVRSLYFPTCLLTDRCIAETTEDESSRTSSCPSKQDEEGFP